MDRFINVAKEQLYQGESYLKGGICLAYINLLQCIANNDSPQLGKICEKTLYREFSSGMQEINYNFKHIQVLNLDENLDDTIKKMNVKCIDFRQTFGAKIDRQANRVSGLSRIQHRRKNFDAYMPNDAEWGH